MNTFERSEELKQAIGKAGVGVYEAKMLATRYDEFAVANILGKAMAELMKVLVLIDPQLRVFPTKRRTETTDDLHLAIADAMDETMAAGDMAKRYGYITVTSILEETSAALVSALALAAGTADEIPLGSTD
jgi:Holliday junction resolvasome RuvABC endonuclease subunit